MEDSDVTQDLHLGMAQNYKQGFRKQRKEWQRYLKMYCSTKCPYKDMKPIYVYVHVEKYKQV